MMKELMTLVVELIKLMFYIIILIGVIMFNIRIIKL